MVSEEERRENLRNLTIMVGKDVVQKLYNIRSAVSPVIDSVRRELAEGRRPQGLDLTWIANFMQFLENYGVSEAWFVNVRDRQAVENELLEFLSHWDLLEEMNAVQRRFDMEHLAATTEKAIEFLRAFETHLAAQATSA